MLPDTLALNWSNDTWHGLGFDDPFDYNGTDNLIIEYRWQGDDNNSVYDRGFYTVGNRACNAASSTAPVGVPRNYLPRVRIFYETVGLAEARPAPATVATGPSIGHLRPDGDCFDALGRRRPATGNGVYFVRARSGSIRRVLVVR